jgi:hypothetical protein
VCVCVGGSNPGIMNKNHWFIRWELDIHDERRYIDGQTNDSSSIDKAITLRVDIARGATSISRSFQLLGRRRTF